MRDNRLFVNGVAAPIAPIGRPSQDEEQGMTFITEEDLLGHLHKVMFTPQIQALRSFPSTKVPAGRYFVMGDNRDNSNDSRYIGFIDRERIVGKATAVAFSLDHAHHWSPRFDRFFKGLD